MAAKALIYLLSISLLENETCVSSYFTGRERENASFSFSEHPSLQPHHPPKDCLSFFLQPLLLWTCPSVSIYYQILRSIHLMDHTVLSCFLAHGSSLPPLRTCFPEQEGRVTVPGAYETPCLWLGKIPNQPCSFASSLSLPATHRLLGWIHKRGNNTACQHARDLSRGEAALMLLLWDDVAIMSRQTQLTARPIFY